MLLKLKEVATKVAIEKVIRVKEVIEAPLACIASRRQRKMLAQYTK